jgi:signal transduction histidine kinase
MTAEQRREAFAPFWQGPGRPAQGSSGLGLAIADQLVRTSHGTIALEHSKSGGIDATVRFPPAAD